MSTPDRNEPMIGSLLEILSQPGVTIKESRRINDSTFEMDWECKGPNSVSITSFSFRFQFDLTSFLVMYPDLFPERTRVSAEWILMLFEKYFSELAPLILVFGQDRYPELAEKLRGYDKKWASIHMEKKFGV